MAFNLDDYNTVPERMAEAHAKYPDGRFQTDIIELPAAYAGQFIAVKARYFRTADDPTPGEGMAWELVPGKTPYTKDSELQNAETSAWGRALIAAFAADAKKGIASREEVQNRQPEPRPRSGGKKVTPSNQSHEDAPRTNGTGEGLSIGQIRADLLLSVNADTAKASMIWRETLAQFGFQNPEQIPDDMKPLIVETLKARVTA